MVLLPIGTMPAWRSRFQLASTAASRATGRHDGDSLPLAYRGADWRVSSAVLTSIAALPGVEAVTSGLPERPRVHPAVSRRQPRPAPGVVVSTTASFRRVFRRFALRS